MGFVFIKREYKTIGKIKLLGLNLMKILILILFWMSRFNEKRVTLKSNNHALSTAYLWQISEFVKSVKWTTGANRIESACIMFRLSKLGDNLQTLFMVKQPNLNPIKAYLAISSLSRLFLLARFLTIFAQTNKLVWNWFEYWNIEIYGCTWLEVWHNSSNETVSFEIKYQILFVLNIYLLFCKAMYKILQFL